MNRRAWLLVALGAVALLASYPPFPLPILSFVAVVPAVLLLQDNASDPRGAYRWGFRYGLAANGVVLYWIVLALWHFTPFAALGYVITIFCLGVFTGGLFWFVTRVRLAYPVLSLAVVFPVAWTALEWAIGHLGDVAFPWLGLGTSLADAPLLVQWADVGGARGITLWLVWCNVLVGSAVAVWGRWPAVGKRLAPVVVTLLLASGYGLWRERSIVLREVGTITLVQPNIGFQEKWVPERADSEVATLLALSRTAAAATKPDLVVWPEAALPYFLTLRPNWQSAIGRFASETRTYVLTGGVHLHLSGSGAHANVQRRVPVRFDRSVAAVSGLREALSRPGGRARAVRSRRLVPRVAGPGSLVWRIRARTGPAGVRVADRSFRRPRLLRVGL